MILGEYEEQCKMRIMQCGFEMTWIAEKHPTKYPEVEGMPIKRKESGKNNQKSVSVQRKNSEGMMEQLGWMCDEMVW